MTPADLKRVKEVFNELAKRDPNKHVIEMVDGRKYSTKQIAQGIERIADGADGMKEENRAGRHVINMIDCYIASGMATLDEVLADFAPNPPKP